MNPIDFWNGCRMKTGFYSLVRHSSTTHFFFSFFQITKIIFFSWKKRNWLSFVENHLKVIKIGWEKDTINGNLPKFEGSMDIRNLDETLAVCLMGKCDETVEMRLTFWPKTEKKVLHTKLVTWYADEWMSQRFIDVDKIVCWSWCRCCGRCCCCFSFGLSSFSLLPVLKTNIISLNSVIESSGCLLFLPLHKTCKHIFWRWSCVHEMVVFLLFFFFGCRWKGEWARENEIYFIYTR